MTDIIFCRGLMMAFFPMKLVLGNLIPKYTDIFWKKHLYYQKKQCSLMTNNLLLIQQGKWASQQFSLKVLINCDKSSSIWKSYKLKVGACHELVLLYQFAT